MAETILRIRAFDIESFKNYLSKHGESMANTKTDRDLVALKNFDSLPDSAHVRLPVVMALVSCSHMTVWRMVKRGTLPAPKKLFTNITAWNVGELRKTLKGF